MRSRYIFWGQFYILKLKNAIYFKVSSGECDVRNIHNLNLCDACVAI